MTPERWRQITDLFHEARALDAGTRLGPYEISARIGVGGMGEVYKARDTRLQRTVAIKVAKEQFSDRFEREAQAVAALNHPNICTLHDVGPNYLVMEYIDGVPVSGPLAVDNALEYANQILAALQSAHEAGIVHRDLKPANILVTRQGVKLLDFGLARLSRPVPGEDSLTRDPTHADQIIGTPAYMSPEQWQGKAADARSDIYAFGLVLYEMLTGRRADRERTPLEQVWLEWIVRKCLAHDPAERFQTADEIRRVLKEGPPVSRSKAMMSIAAGIIVVLATGAYLWRLNTPAPTLTDQDVLVVADFENSTGEAVFDTALRQALAFQLDESPFLKAMDDAHVRQALTLSGRRADERVTGQIARDICIREGEKATLEGAIARLGSSYLLSLQAINCQSGETMAREQVQAADKEHVVQALATAMTSMRGKLGESLPAIAREQRAYDHGVTTTSVEALQAFHMADAEWFRSMDSRSAIPFYERATQLDPNFAMAWAVLAMRYASVGDLARAREYTDKAYSLVNRVSERERLFITAQQHSLNGEIDKAIELHEVLARTYPRDPMWPGNLARMYVGTGRFEKGLAAAHKGIELGPKIPGGYAPGFHAAMILNRPDEARAIVERAFAEGLDGSPLHAFRLRVAFVSDDTATAAREIAWFESHPDALGVWHQAVNAAARGQDRRATALLQSAEQLARSAQSDINPRRIEMDRAVKNALFGRCPTTGARPQQDPPIAAALCGDMAIAEKLIEEQSKAGGPTNGGPPAYLRAHVLLEQGRAREAAAAFEAILQHKAISWGAEYAAAQVGLARAAALAGDIGKARMAYDNFFALWKDADADVPLLVAARREYAKLQ